MPTRSHASCNSRANLDYDTIKSFKDNGLRLLLVGYESGNDEILRRIKKGVTTERMRRFTRDCHRAGVVIHGTFILGLPVETRETIEETLRNAESLDRTVLFFFCGIRLEPVLYASARLTNEGTSSSAGAAGTSSA